MVHGEEFLGSGLGVTGFGKQIDLSLIVGRKTVDEATIKIKKDGFNHMGYCSKWYNIGHGDEMIRRDFAL